MLLFLLACHGPAAPPANDGPPAPPSDTVDSAVPPPPTDTVPSDGTGTSPTGDTAVEVSPVVVVERPDLDVFLYWEATVDRPGPWTVHLTSVDGERTWTVDGDRIALPWLHAATDYTLVLEGDGRATVDFTTLPLPEPFPRIEVLADQGGHPGATVVPVSHPDHGLIVVLDEAMAPVWVAVRPSPWYAVTWHEDRFVGIRGHDIRSVTLDGVWARVGAGATLHHDVRVLDDGYLTLSEGLVDVDAFPTEGCGPLEPATLRDHDVLWLDAKGAAVDGVAMRDVLQTSRCSWGSHIEDDGGFDWVHLNTAAPDGDGVLVSSRHQQAIARLDADGQLDWLLARPDGWDPAWEARRLQPVGEVTWPADQHSPRFDPATQTLTVFDNGGHRDDPGAPDGSTGPWPSRVVAYQLDLDARTVSEAWSWAPSTPLVAAIMGDAQPLPDGHVFSTWTWIDGDGIDPAETLGWGARSTRLLEFVPGETDPVLDVRLRSTQEELAEGWWTFRAQRVPWEAFGVVAP